MTAPSVGLNPGDRRHSRAARTRARRRHAIEPAACSRRPSSKRFRRKVQLVGNVRVNGASYRARAADSPIVNGQPLWPDDELDATGVAFRDGRERDRHRHVERHAPTSAAAFARRTSPTSARSASPARASKSRRPTSPALAARSARRPTPPPSRSARRSSRSGPETSLTYEGGLHFRRPTVRSTLAVFVNEIHDNIAKQSLILPAGAVGKTLGGTPITSQSAERRRLRRRRHQSGARARQLRQRAHHRRGAHLRLAADARIGSPARPSPICARRTRAPGCRRTSRGARRRRRPTFTSTTRRSNGRWWAGTYLHAAAAQDRLSTLDLDDRRTGAGRSRTSIRNFFLNGATARGWVGAGGDNAIGTADDVLLATGETVAQIQDRVLGVGVASAPLYREVGGFFTAGFRGGVRIGRHEIIVDIENITDDELPRHQLGRRCPGPGGFAAIRRTVLIARHNASEA